MPSEQTAEVLAEFRVIHNGGRVEVEASWPTELDRDHAVASAIFASAARAYRDAALRS